ncbi:hypothetical protein [Pajaroellobacter abortibovis]|uniref:Uncharacterized protein n=1 Tax=Pajaroellobacter abortibovis TaxID=1882918 RepID=A0A1L6MV07_9BACT|nr:hypothetical protein [Pajaroellobacter abortibovis]APR99352.1 hypothetical protein BCY86_00660 [Pajaroellobacter abortibovis]
MKCVLFINIIFLLGACRHKATEAECTLLIAKNVELQMKAMHISDPALIETRQKEIEANLQHEIPFCIGRSTSKRTIRCVQEASSLEQLDRCLR